MAEAATVVGLVASIAELIDLGAKVTSHINEFTSQAFDIPESFAALSTRLPLLDTSLRLISSQTQAGRRPQDVVNALQTVITSISDRVTVLQTCLSQILPPTDASLVQQATQALKGLAKEKETHELVDKIHKDIDFLVLHQTAQYANTGERILEELADLQLGPPSSSGILQGHHFPSVSAHDQSKIHLGDVYHIDYRKSDEVRSLGLCLNSAPVIDKSNFVGRAIELDEMRDVLQPGETSVERRRLVLGGIGGIGKTQLAIAYARCYKRSYSSVLWLNATSETTLYTSFRSIARGIVVAEDLAKLDNDQILTQVHQWLSHSENTQWLLIFDNYDDPDHFQIENFCPDTGHGSIIITTRLPELVTDQPLQVQPLKAIDESLAILQARSKRKNVKGNPDARRLAERLGGLPLALVTAGAYLQKSTLTFQQYLDIYERDWHIDRRRRLRLHEYHDRTLYTTWNLTYQRLAEDDSDAAHMLKLLAYFDNQEVWFELLQAGNSAELPGWLQATLFNQVSFESAMRTLVEYCLVELQHAGQSYSIHSCVHDWTLGELNKVIEPQLYWYAFDCVVISLNEDDWVSLGHVRYNRVSHHGVRLTYDRFWQSNELDSGLLTRIKPVNMVAHLLSQQAQLSAAEQMYLRALAGHEKAQGPDHIWTLNTVNNIGLLYRDQGKLDEAEQMYLRALTGYEKTLGLDHKLTLDSKHCLAMLYYRQNKLDQANLLYQQLLVGYKTVVGDDHLSTIMLVYNFALLYERQNRLEEAKEMYERALVGCQKRLGSEHQDTRGVADSLDRIHRRQNE